MTSTARPAPDSPARMLRRFCIACVAAAIVSAAVPAARAEGLTPEVSSILGRLGDANLRGGHDAGILTQRERAVLFANNDAVNRARLNNQIPNHVYQAAQGDFDRLNQQFAKDAATAANAEFTVQKRSSQTFTPGTDSDYITIVENKGQIKQMQEGYNQRVNDFIKNSGAQVPPRSNWHNKLDTDFMADPRKITDPNEFREIAKMNNDAYKNRFAADYERISRAGTGEKIGPQHVTGYMEEMNDFTKKKGKSIDEMLAKGPGHFSNADNRADIFRTMAQEQKYTSRLEALDDFLRKQEGLPPRNRGATIAALGADRAPHNAARIRDAHAVADASRMTAMEDLAETMGQVAKKNPAFNPNAADDIAKIVEGLPAERRAGVLARIRANQGQGMVDDILGASARAGRLPPGSASLADDVARAGSKADDAARATSKLDDLARLAPGRGTLAAAADAMDALGKAATSIEVATAAAQMSDYLEKMRRATDPNTPQHEADKLFDEAQELGRTLWESGALAALAERYPPVAAIYGTWTVACIAGELRSPTPEVDALMSRSGAPRTCLDRHVSAWDSARDWWTGKTEEREEHNRALCSKFMKAVREGRISLRGSFTVKDVCEALKRGEKIGDMLRTATVSPNDVKADPPPAPPVPDVVLAPPTCDPGKNAGIVADLRLAAAGGSQPAAAHIARIEAINGQIASANASYQAARQSYSAGDMGAVRASLNQAKATVDGFGGTPDCSDLGSKIASGLERADRMDRILTDARDAIGRCDGAALSGLASRYGSVDNPALRGLLDKANDIGQAQAAWERARSEYAQGALDSARSSLASASAALSRAGADGCADLARKVAEGIGRADRLREAIAAGQQAVTSCDPNAIDRWKGSFAALSNPAASSVKAALDRAITDCKARDRDVAEARAKAAAESRQSVCIRDYGPGYEVGHILEDGRFFCKPTQSVASAWCENKYGSGYFARNINSRGGFDCMPTKQAADAWCNRNNTPNSGWHASSIQPNGQFTCHLSEAAQRAAATADCRQRYGQRLIRVYKQNGQYWCQHQQGQPVVRQQPTRQQPARDPQADAAAAAAAAAVAGAVIQGIQSSRNRGRAPPPQQRCHRNPRTGQVHCGAN